MDEELIGAEVIHADDFGTLVRQEIPGDEPMVAVRPLGGPFLRVPPDTKTVKEGLEWTQVLGRVWPKEWGIGG